MSIEQTDEEHTPLISFTLSAEALLRLWLQESKRQQKPISYEYLDGQDKKLVSLTTEDIEVMIASLKPTP